MTDANDANAADPNRPAYLDYWNQDLSALPAINPGTRKAKHDIGVCYRGTWEQPFNGFQQHTRTCVKALADTGLPVKLVSLSMVHQLSPAADTAQAWVDIRQAMEPYVMTELGQHIVEVLQLTPEPSNFFRFLAPNHPYMNSQQLAARHRGQVIYTVFECDTVPGKGTVDLLKRAGQVWVANQKDVDMLVTAGLEPDRVAWIPVPYSSTSPLLELRGPHRAPGPPRFYHIGKWEPRKAQDKLLAAFLLAFEPGEARLFIKTTKGLKRVWERYPATATEALTALADHQMVRQRGWTPQAIADNIFINDAFVSEEQIFAMHDTGDIYATLSRGEGYDMPAFDAKLAGNRMIFTPSGGPQDFASVGDFLVPRSGSVKPDPFYNWGDVTYLDFSMTSAVDAFRAAANAVRGPARSPAPLGDLEHARSDIVGQKMRAQLEKLAPDLKKL